MRDDAGTCGWQFPESFDDAGKLLVLPLKIVEVVFEDFDEILPHTFARIRINVDGWLTG